MSLQPTQAPLGQTLGTPAQGTRALQAANAYASTERGDAGAANSFGNALQQALNGVAKAGHEADAQAATALTGSGNLTEVVTAIAKAELALQATMAVRDRMVQAYQDIMRMPI